MSRRRTLSDSEARWEAVATIDSVMDDWLSTGALYGRVEFGPWTEADADAVAQHIADRCSGLVRRPRKAAQSGCGEADRG